ncbi:hypothetical protein [Aquimarina sp. AU474]|uniref:hypothetical protein n=1 Tax=Aquimarina sp. AU474 TaxID=2108529 RepID=UPI000D68F4E2|nr:hypothetical protein [Aquimarina sp. AU474]
MSKYLVIFMLWSIVIHGQSIFKTLEPESLPPNWESWIDSTPISGFKKQGIQFVSSQKKINPLMASVFLPKSISKQKICLRITSIDGRYRANLIYKIDQAENGMLNLSIPTKYQEKLKHYKPDEVALLATMDVLCDSNIGKNLIASWERKKNLSEFQINFNSRKDVNLLVVENGRVLLDKPFEDLNLKKDNPVSFNRSCKVPINIVSKDSSIFVRETWVKENGKIQIKEYEFPIIL